MTDYKIISHSIQVEFEKLIAAALKEGWKLQGGVSTHNYFYSQALTKEIKNKT